MTRMPTVLCPVDFSDANRASIRYATAVAEHFGAALVFLTVEDPLLTEALDLGTGTVWTPDDTRKELARFVEKIIRIGHNGAHVEYDVAVGKPAVEILRIAEARKVDLIVMGTHGLTGMRKLFFGSTTERVLRETTVPVLATPPSDPGTIRLSESRSLVRRILVPVDLTEHSLHQVQVARAMSEALQVPFIAVHVIEPVRSPLAEKLHLPRVELERKTRAEDALDNLIATVPRQLHPEALVAYGDPAEEIAKLVRDRQAGLIVIGLHASPLLGPRMGSVTYRVLCLAPALVLALPPDAAARRLGSASAQDATADTPLAVHGSTFKVPGSGS
jgi:nucleotide-binding universal stress UspA family protein